MRQWDTLIDGYARICATLGLSRDLIPMRRCGGGSWRGGDNGDANRHRGPWYDDLLRV